ncbi:S41 family peptidase [Hymenobacter endophyticus]|uniref:S41 family peptidase n=1 Tax=Hymenobacter endophyticus TaxID=3076335 RepID=A0ABU3TN69_9BACT|nr:S41 family peptidase [Hymenobacter endophyticus]MDU0372833.1 S41 family peptidase [Hymenobacter endophyticus]
MHFLHSALLLAALPLATSAAPRPLTARETRNLSALTKLVGDAKYFYPNRHTARLSWETVLVRSIPAVRRARTDVALTRTLDSLLRPLAPEIRLSLPNSPTAPAALATMGTGPYYFWEHHSLGQDKTGLPVARLMLRLAGIPYASTIRAASGAVADSLFPSGQRRYTAALTDSMRLELPLVLTEAQYRRRLSYRLGRRVRRLSAATPEQRLATVMLTWNILQHFYPYRAVLERAQWEAVLPAALQQAAQAATEAELLAACRTLLAHLPDRHVAIGPKTRTGLRIVDPPWALQLVLVEDQVVVRQIPAALQPAVARGTVLTHVNGQSVGFIIDTLQTHIPATSPAVARQLAAEQLLTNLTTRAPAATFTLRDSLGHSTIARWPFRQLRGSLYNQAPPVQELVPGLVYVDAARLRYPDFERALPQLQAAQGLVIDVRQRPHYDLLRILPHFTQQPLLTDSLAMPLLRQPAFSQAEFEGEKSARKLPQLPFIAAPKVFLVGPHTYSYGETIAELVRRHQLGLLLGQTTGGTNGEMNFAAIGRAYLLSWTGRRVVSRGGSYQGEGITPDEAVTPTLRQVAAGRDAEIERAVELLQKNQRPN